MVSEALRDELRPYRFPPFSPHPNDSMSKVLDIDPEEFEFIAERLFARLELPMPSPANPEEIPEIATILDLAAYLHQKHTAKVPSKARPD